MFQNVLFTPKHVALAEALEVDPSTITKAYEDDHFKHGKYVYMVLTEAEAMIKIKDHVVEFIYAFDSEVLNDFSTIKIGREAFHLMVQNMSESVGPIFLQLIGGNLDALIERVITMDGRGHLLNTYDNDEIEAGDFFAYLMDVEN